MKIKRKSLALVLAALFVFTLTPSMAVHANDITVTVNGQPVTFADQGPIIVDGRTLVPAAGVFQALGFSVRWQEATQQATVARPGDTVVITIGSNTFTANGTPHTLDVPAQIIGGRTMLPIAGVLRAVGYDVGWDGATNTVLIGSGATVTQATPTPPAAQEAVPVQPGQPEAVVTTFTYTDASGLFRLEIPGFIGTTGEAHLPYFNLLPYPNREDYIGTLKVFITPETPLDGVTIYPLSASYISFWRDFQFTHADWGFYSPPAEISSFSIGTGVHNYNLHVLTFDDYSFDEAWESWSFEQPSRSIFNFRGIVLSPILADEFLETGIMTYTTYGWGEEGQIITDHEVQIPGLRELILAARMEGYLLGTYITIQGEQFSTELTSLNLSNRNLTDMDIVPLQYMTNLAMLFLSGNQITDLTPLAGLTNLWVLELSGNLITDWSPVEHVENVIGRP